MRDRWASRHGCSLPSLRLMPEQYVLTQPQQCRDFFARHGPRCRAVPCAGWLVAQTRRMEEEKHQLVRALHEPLAAGRAGPR